MATTLYAAFADASMAEKAAGALLDHGVRAEDLSLVQHESRNDLPTTTREDTGYVPPDIESSVTGIPPLGVETDNPLDHGPSAGSVGGFGPVSGMSRGGVSAPTNVHEQAGYRSAYDDSRPDEGDLEETEDPLGPTMMDEYDRPAGNLGVSGTVSTGAGAIGTGMGATDDMHRQYDYKADDDINPKEGRKDPEAGAKHGITTTTAGDAGAGAITGAAFGLGLGAAAALASLLVPGVGLIVGGGALATALGGMAATTGAGAAVGAVTGYLKDQGVEEQMATKYGDTVSGGGAVLAVHVPSGTVDEARAREVLSKYGAANVNSYAYTGRGYVA